MMSDEGRFDRQARFFGVEGQKRLRKTRVAVIGAGGLGSHLVQQLSFLGVGAIHIIDHDVVELTNLNRLIGAHYQDPSLRTPKVEVARRLVQTIDPSIEVFPIQQDLVSPNGFEGVKLADFVFGCVDSDGPRLVLTELCAAYERPYFDLASEIPIDSQSDFGGRVCFSRNGDGCPACLQLLSPDDLNKHFRSPEQRRDFQALYGVSMNDLGPVGPSVVSLNGMVASLAVMEFTVHVTGLRKARRLLYYRGREGKVTVSTDEPQRDCFYCRSVFGTRSSANVERYLDQGTQLGEYGPHVTQENVKI